MKPYLRLPADSSAPGKRKVSRLESLEQRTLRAMIEATAINFCTTVPFNFGEVGFQRIGFADTPVVGFNAITPDSYDIIPVARQHILRAISGKGVDIGAVKLTLTVGARSRKRMFVDTNPNSQSKGKKKFGTPTAYYLEITMPSEVPAYREAFERVYL